MKQLSLILSFLFFTLITFAQGSLKGQITDAETDEPLIGANIIVGTTGVTSDFDGNYILELPKGTHDVKFSYIGFEEVVKTVTIDNQDVTLDVRMGGSLELETVTVTADIAIARKTPVAFTNVSTAKLNEELASQDLPMVLNSTPGAYATQTGGGDGDARVTIRGFNQRSIAVMLDGIPVNDMENGWVYWSNWFGLDLVTKTMQVQRGLGASKLAVPSVGGTINILTKGIDAKRQTRFKQEIGNNGQLRSTIGFTSGRLDNGWGISAAGSYKQGDGWANGNFTKGYFYYLRIDKQLGNHLISVSGFGAPQQHGQRFYNAPIATYDTTYAKELGVLSSEFPGTGLDRGLRYNQHVGLRNGEMQNTKINYYHKPQFSLRHSWKGGERLFLSNVAYLSIGNGGGTGTRGSLLGTDDLDSNGFINLDAAYAQNTTPSIFKPEGLSENYLYSSVNNHFWYGLLSTVEFNINDNWSLSGGIDLRSYEGEHKRELYDLYGGTYIKNEGNSANPRLPSDTKLVVGDNIQYNYVSNLNQGGLFGLIEYDKNKLSVFLNGSLNMTSYAYEDHLGKKVLTTDSVVYFLGFDDVVTLPDGTTYDFNSPEAVNYKLDGIYRTGFTVKTGAAYRINDQHGLFVNTGYLSRPTRYNNVILTSNAPDSTNRALTARNEVVLSFELGYNFKSPRFAANVNTYYTLWNNKPLNFIPYILEDPSDPESDRIYVNVQGIAARHSGIEVDFAYKITDKFTVEGLASIGDWIWNSADTVLLPDGVTTYEFDAKGVHVGDAAQIQVGGLVRYEPIKGLYFKLKATHFAKNYANFNPEDLKGENAGRDSWKMPNYTLVDLHTGYNFKIKNIPTGIRFNILNLLNTKYVSDANNNDNFTQSFDSFDARSAAVFLGQGIRWNTSIQFTF